MADATRGQLQVTWVKTKNINSRGSTGSRGSVGGRV